MKKITRHVQWKYSKRVWFRWYMILGIVGKGGTSGLFQDSIQQILGRPLRPICLCVLWLLFQLPWLLPGWRRRLLENAWGLTDWGLWLLKSLCACWEGWGDHCLEHLWLIQGLPGALALFLRSSVLRHTKMNKASFLWTRKAPSSRENRLMMKGLIGIW